jgi:D-alanine-D-alanine ligase
MPDPRVLILYNEPVLPPDHPERGAEEDVLYSVKVVRESLKAVGMAASQYGVTNDPAALLARLRHPDYDVAFNLYEGNGDNSVTEVYFTGLLEWLRIPYTGCPSFTLSVARNKPVAKRLFAAAGIRTPEFVLVESVAHIPAGVPFPAIVKPANEDASVGIDQASVVTTGAALAARVRYVVDRYGPPALVERFVAGREIQVSVIDLAGTGDPAVLPLAEIAFRPDSGHWPVYTYTAKWHEDSDEYKAAPVKVGVEVPSDVHAELAAVAKRVYRLLGARDFARIDTRVTPAGEVYVLEMNPNPAITSVMIDDGLPAVGATYDQFIAALARNAWNRGRRSAAGGPHRPN